MRLMHLLHFDFASAFAVTNKTASIVEVEYSTLPRIAGFLRSIVAKVSDMKFC